MLVLGELETTAYDPKQPVALLELRTELIAKMTKLDSVARRQMGRFDEDV